MIRIFQGVLVIRLLRWDNHQLELCIFPPFKVIERHKHDESNIELLHIWGKAAYERWQWFEDKKSMTYNGHVTRLFKDCFRFFTIPKGAWHAAKIGWTGLITISCQTWDKTKPVTSVTEDFKTYGK